LIRLLTAPGIPAPWTIMMIGPLIIMPITLLTVMPVTNRSRTRATSRLRLVGRRSTFVTHEIYISTDVETDGPIPGPHSMLSLGAAAYTADKTLVSTFSANLETLSGAQAHPKTAAARGRDDEVCPLDPFAQRRASVRRIPGGLRFHIRLLVLDEVCGREPLQPLGTRHEIFRDGNAQDQLSREHKAKHAEAVVR
jgi:hypothetical protein